MGAELPALVRTLNERLDDELRPQLDNLEKALQLRTLILEKFGIVTSNLTKDLLPFDEQVFYEAYLDEYGPVPYSFNALSDEQVTALRRKMNLKRIKVIFHDVVRQQSQYVIKQVKRLSAALTQEDWNTVSALMGTLGLRLTANFFEQDRKRRYDSVKVVMSYAVINKVVKSSTGGESSGGGQEIEQLMDAATIESESSTLQTDIGSALYIVAWLGS